MADSRARTTRDIRTLTRLQGLRVLRDEQTMAQANAQLSQAERVEERTRAAAAEAKANTRKLTRSPGFSIDEMHLLRSLESTCVQELADASGKVLHGAHCAEEARRAWHSSRHQKEVLEKQAISQEKQYARKSDEHTQRDLRDGLLHLRKDSMS